MTPYVMKSCLKVIIVGAGPVGQLLALVLAKDGIFATVVEQSSKLDESPRATHYGPAAMKVLNKAGLGDSLREKGFIPNTVCWRKLDGTLLTGIPVGTMKDELECMVALPLNQLGPLIYSHAKIKPEITYLFDSRVTATGQDDQKAWIHVRDLRTNKESSMEADYVIGCDGANSIIRRCLFGEWEFPGKTWDQQIVATNVYYDFHKFWEDDSNFIIDPEHWYMAAKITKDGMWRVTYGELPSLTRDELIARQPQKFKTMLPGHPGPGDYRLTNISPYKIHQRLAKQMRVGRILLAGDAAHLCNPFGGLGLTGGIVDAGGLHECLVGIHQGKANASILDRYNDIRREKYQQIVDPVSSANFLRLLQDAEKVMEADEFLKICKAAETDAKLTAQMLEGMYGLNYDFTQHYDL